MLQILFEKARQGHLYTARQFAVAFENKAGLDGNTVIRKRLSVLATEGFIQFFRDAKAYGLPLPGRSRFGSLCIEGMELDSAKQRVDPVRGRLVLRPSATMRLACPLVTGLVLRQWALSCRRPARRQGRPL